MEFPALADARVSTRRRVLETSLTRSAKFVRRYPLGVVSLFVLLVISVAAVAAPVVAPFDPYELHREDRLFAPGSTYLFGTDSTGRDQFSRIIYGARVSLAVGVGPPAIAVFAGTLIGAISAYFGGIVDVILQRLMDALIAFPALLLVLIAVTLLSPTTTNVILVIAVVMFPAVNRVARGSVIAVLAEPYVEASRTIGASNTRILFRHVLPNIMAPVIIIGTSLIGVGILAEAALSFLGLGVPPPTPTWGNMMSGEGRNIFVLAPWLVIFPGLAITITVLVFNLFGDTVRDVLDPRLREA